MWLKENARRRECALQTRRNCSTDRTAGYRTPFIYYKYMCLHTFDCVSCPSAQQRLPDQPRTCRQDAIQIQEDDTHNIYATY